MLKNGEVLKIKAFPSVGYSLIGKRLLLLLQETNQAERDECEHLLAAL